MAEPSRTDAACRDVEYPTGVPEIHHLGPNAEQGSFLEFSESASPATPPALNRSAEAVGRSVGTAVARVRRLPRELDKLRSRIRLVPKRERAEKAISEIKDSALEAAADWRDAAEDSLAELRDRAETYRYEIAERTNRGLGDVRRRTAVRIEMLRRSVRDRLETARQWETDRPLQFIGGCVATGFVAGIAFRIWRSRRVWHS